MERILPYRDAGVVRWTAVVATLALSSGCWAETGNAPASPKIDGRELFIREWVPGDSRAGEGDGLGPVFNDSSCVACHNQGGVGGAGPSEKNVDIISASRSFSVPRSRRGSSITKHIVRKFFGGESGRGQKVEELEVITAQEVNRQKAAEEREALGRIHPGFLTQGSLVLHHFAVDPGYQEWRARFGFGQVISMPGFLNDALMQRRLEAQMSILSSGLSASQIEGFTFQRFQRNPTALFGAGLIDAIPESALLEAAGRKHDRFPEISGRMARLEGGGVGRFGWKAQESSLDGFVRTACAVELGLHVPGRPQSGLPAKPERRAPGYDLREEEVGALVSYLAGLPRPVERRSSGGPELMLVEEGEAHFRDLGCAACHSPTLGEVKGLYSDLLLHDLGPELGDQGSYGAFSPDVAGGKKLDKPLPQSASPGVAAEEITFSAEVSGRPSAGPPAIGSLASEWRTPPLWGLRDSAPYLHDGRAPNLEQAIAFHGGEGEPSAQRYFKLPAEGRLAVQSFLKSLSAP